MTQAPYPTASSIIFGRLTRRSAAFAFTACLATTTVRAQVRFTDVSEQVEISGGRYVSTTDHSLGVLWVDVNTDGHPDLFAVGGDPENPPRLFLNLGDGTFTPASHLLPTLPAVEMSGAVFADHDNDGDPDIYIYTDATEFYASPMGPPPTFSGPANLLLKNLFVERGGVVGAPLFEEVAARSGVADLAPTPFSGGLPGHRAKCAAWLDYDRDGCVDLFVAHFVFRAAGHLANRDRLYRNRCDGTFEDVTERAGLSRPDQTDRFRPTLACLAGHLDDDRWPDIYAAHADDAGPTHGDFIFKNNGDGTFTEVTRQMPGVGDDAWAAMGVAVADIDLDGDWDVYLSDNIFPQFDAEPPGNPLYLGRGDGTFADNSAPAAGVVATDSWPVNFFDIDQDGYEDLFVGSISDPDLRPSFLYMNQGDGTFVDAAQAMGGLVGNRRGAAVADHDGDGDLDLAIVNEDDVSILPQMGLQLLRNDSKTGNWLQVKLQATTSNRSAIGAVVTIDAGGRTQRRQVIGGMSAHSQDWLTLHFGLGAQDQVDRLHVWFPSGETAETTAVAVNQRVTVIEPNRASSSNCGLVGLEPWLVVVLAGWSRRRRARR